MVSLLQARLMCLVEQVANAVRNCLAAGTPEEAQYWESRAQHFGRGAKAVTLMLAERAPIRTLNRVLEMVEEVR